MLRAIPLPDETLWLLKQKNANPMTVFALRMALYELDLALKLEGIDKDINVAEIEHLVVTGDWPEC